MGVREKCSRSPHPHFEQEVEDVTCFADAGPRRLVGNYMHSGSLGGFFDAAGGAFDPEAFVDFRTDEAHSLLTTQGVSAEGSIGYERTVESMISLTVWLAIYFGSEIVLWFSPADQRERTPSR